MLPTSHAGSRHEPDPAMTLSEAVLWSLGGVATLVTAAALATGSREAVVLFGLGALAVAIGVVLGLLRLRGGVPRRHLDALAHLGTVLITVAVLVGGGAGELLVPLYGFVAVVAGGHLAPRAALRHLVAVIVAVGLLVGTGTVAPGRAAVLLGAVVATGLVVGDVARRAQAAAARHEQQEEWRTAMLGTLAHDIRTPLTVVRATLQTVAHQNGLLDDQTRMQLLSAADEHAAAIERLSADLLDVDRVRHGQLTLTPMDVPLVEVLGRLGTVRADDLDVDVDAGLRVHADVDRLEQVLNNLVRNAVVHGDPPVEVRASPDAGGVRIVVRDHGPGIPEHRRETVFDRFAHGGDAASTGLGLWIVRALVGAHGGWVEVTDASPGAAFVVWLPDGPAAVSRAGAGDRAAGRMGGRR